MSIDNSYETPITQRPEPCNFKTFSEYEVFHQLDNLRATACGLDGLPHWFLWIAAPCFSSPIAFPFNLSLTWSIVPRQWKVSRITPVPKVSRANVCSDYRPISINLILSRIMEKTINNSSTPSFIVHCFTINFRINSLSGRLALLPAHLSSLHTNWPWCFKSIHMFMPSALTSQRHGIYGLCDGRSWHCITKWDTLSWFDHTRFCSTVKVSKQE